MLRSLPLTIALILVVAAGIVHGRWTQRWTVSHAVEDAVARVGRLPMTLGNWEGTSFELDRRQLALGEIEGYIARRYEDRRHGDVVTILLVCGAPGPISVHTPDVCYAGSGFDPIGPVGTFSVPLEPSDPPARFRDSLMGKPSASGPTYLRILWSWSTDGAWEAPENPRLAFAPRNVLYKLYVIRKPTSADEPIEADPSPRFLRLLLPELEKTLFGPTNATLEANGADSSAQLSLSHPGDTRQGGRWR